MGSLKSKQKSIASRLALARAQAGLSQGQISRLMDMHRPSISEIEAGRRKVTADRIQLAARELSKLKRQDFDKVIGLLTAMKGKMSK